MSWSSGLNILLLCLIIPSFVLLTLLNFTNVDIVRHKVEENPTYDVPSMSMVIGTHGIFTDSFDKSQIGYVSFSECGSDADFADDGLIFFDKMCKSHAILMRYITAAFILSFFVMSTLGVFLFIMRKTSTILNSKIRILFFFVVFISVGSMITNILLFLQVGFFKGDAEKNFIAATINPSSQIVFKSSYVPSIMTYTGFPLVLQSCMLLTLLLFYFKVVMNAQGYEQFGRA